jgi:RNA polymerase sigma-70 factor (ECF subfamily)
LTEERLRSLLVRGLVGDEPAYRIFLGELAAHLRSWLRGRLARLPEEVEDLLQELLLAVHNQRHTYEPKQPLKPWVHAIARYKFIDLLRRLRLARI